MGALPCHVPLPQRRLNADHAINAGENIGKGNADLLRFAIRRAGQIHDAAHRLDHEIIACTLGIRSALAKTGDRTIDQTRIDRFEAFIIKAILFQPADLEILDQHIGVGRKPPDRRLTFRRFEIHRNRALSAIACMEIGGREITTVGGCNKGRAPCSRIIARSRAFHFHDIRAEISQSLANPRPRQNAGEFENADAGKGFG